MITDGADHKGRANDGSFIKVICIMATEHLSCDQVNYQMSLIICAYYADNTHSRAQAHTHAHTHTILLQRMLGTGVRMHARACYVYGPSRSSK